MAGYLLYEAFWIINQYLKYALFISLIGKPGNKLTRIKLKIYKTFRNIKAFFPFYFDARI